MADYDEGASHQTVPLNGPTDHTAPLKGIIVCCTSVPDEKRVSLSNLHAIAPKALSLSATDL